MSEPAGMNLLQRAAWEQWLDYDQRNKPRSPPMPAEPDRIPDDVLVKLEELLRCKDGGCECCGVPIVLVEKDGRVTGYVYDWLLRNHAATLIATARREARVAAELADMRQQLIDAERAHEQAEERHEAELAEAVKLLARLRECKCGKPGCVYYDAAAFVAKHKGRPG